MRHVIILDEKISNSEFGSWRSEDRQFFNTHLGVGPTYEAMRFDYTNYPTYIDAESDTRPTEKFLQSLANMVTSKYGESGFAFDFIKVMIHEDNWPKRKNPKTGKSIWGTNYSYTFGNFCLEYVRWDKDNPANTFGVAYHERHHSFDAIIKIETGIDIRPYLGVSNYDHEITHGNSPDWSYIRHKENVESLKIMAPFLQKAFLVRQQKHRAVLDNQTMTLIRLAEQARFLLRKSMNKKVTTCAS